MVGEPFDFISNHGCKLTTRQVLRPLGVMLLGLVKLVQWIKTRSPPPTLNGMDSEQEAGSGDFPPSDFHWCMIWDWVSVSLSIPSLTQSHPTSVNGPWLCWSRCRIWLCYFVLYLYSSANSSPRNIPILHFVSKPRPLQLVFCALALPVVYLRFDDL